METKEFKRDRGFEGLPHYYDDNFNEFKSLNGLFVKELCPICKAHLSHTGICLNACHLSDSMKKQFSEMMKQSFRQNEEGEP